MYDLTIEALQKEYGLDYLTIIRMLAILKETQYEHNLKRDILAISVIYRRMESINWLELHREHASCPAHVFYLRYMSKIGKRNIETFYNLASRGDEIDATTKA